MAISTVAEDYRWSLLAAAGGALAFLGMIIALSAGRVRDAREEEQAAPA
jgi:hypothetical protein